MTRQLTDIELQEIRKAIMRKEISSAEILMEVYDHYISHLQEFPIEEFNDQLFELEEKFTIAYCHALQAKFSKKIRKELSRTHWNIIRKYFCISRILYVLGFLVIAFYLRANLKEGKEAAILMLTPFFLLKVFHLFFLVKSNIRIKKIKKVFNQTSPLQSALFYPLSERIYLPAILAFSMIWLGENLFGVNLFNSVGPQISAIFSIPIFLYVISLIEVWQIKSKTALI